MPGFRLDTIFHIIRIGFFFGDRDLVTKNIEKANRYDFFRTILRMLMIA